jgi:hypothetical protein
MKKAAIVTVFAILPMLLLASIHAAGAEPDRTLAARAAIHPVATQVEMQAWLSRVPQTRDYPPDFDATLKGQGAAFVIEMSTTPGCLPCGDLWTRLLALKSRYGLIVSTIDEQEAMLRSGRLGLPWIGHPVLWLRPVSDSGRTLPMAIGTDHAVNIARNLYLGIKMQTGVRPAVGVRAMAKFTGIVGPAAPSAPSHRRKG